MVTKEISLNIWEENQVLIYNVQGEVDSRQLKISFITQEGTNLDLSSKTITIYAEKPDGTKIYNDCTIDTSTNTAIVNITSQMVSAVGILECEFQIFDSNNLLLKVTGLKLVVNSKGDFSQAIESTSEYNALTQAINEAKSLSIQTGTWTPQLICPDGTNPTYTAEYTCSYYYRIGDLVYITFFIHANISNIGSGTAYIDGLPFIVATNTNRQALAISAYGSLDAKTTFYAVNGSSSIRVGLLSGGTQNWVTGNIFLGGSGCYLIDKN